jgi:hypothetical protein
VIDDDRPVLRAFDDAARSQRHVFNRARINDHRHDDVAALGHVGRGGRCNGAGVDQRFHRLGSACKYRHAMPALQQIPRDRRSHGAEPNHADISHRL